MDRTGTTRRERCGSGASARSRSTSRHQSDVDTLRALIGRADVFLESFRPGVAAARGFGYEELHAAHPRLVYCSISGYGQDGPWRDRPGFDCLVAAKLGVMAEQGGHREGPIFLGHPSIGYGTAFLATIGILSALRARRITGAGQHVDTSLLDSVVAQSAMNWWWNAHDVSYLARSGSELGFGRNRIITDLFLCQDNEYLMIHTGGDGGFKRTMDILGVGECVRAIDGPEMAVALDDDEYHAARHLAPAAFGNRPRAEWVELFHAADLAALPVLRPTEVLLDDQVAHAGVVIELPDQQGRKLRQVGPAVIFRGSPPATPTPAPAVGAHDAGEVLASLPRARRLVARRAGCRRRAGPRPRRSARPRLQRLLRRRLRRQAPERSRAPTSSRSRRSAATRCARCPICSRPATAASATWLST